MGGKPRNYHQQGDSGRDRPQSALWVNSISCRCQRLSHSEDFTRVPHFLEKSCSEESD